MNIDLLGDKLMIRPLSVKVESAVIEIPDDAEKDGVKYAEVVRAGCGIRDGDKFLPLIIKAGDTIMHNISAPLEVEFNGEELQLIAESSVIGVVYD